MNNCKPGCRWKWRRRQWADGRTVPSSKVSEQSGPDPFPDHTGALHTPHSFPPVGEIKSRAVKSKPPSSNSSHHPEGTNPTSSLFNASSFQGRLCPGRLFRQMPHLKRVFSPRRWPCCPAPAGMLVSVTQTRRNLVPEWARGLTLPHRQQLSPSASCPGGFWPTEEVG